MDSYIENTKNIITNTLDTAIQGYYFSKDKILHFYNENKFMKDYFPYISYIGLEIIHYSLIVLITLCMLINKLSTILFYQWTDFMKLTGRKRIILDRETDEPYIERYYLFLTDRNETFPFNIFIHHILKSDNDELHDHPWGYFTFILSGGYYEHLKLTEAGSDEEKIVKVWRGPGFYQSVSSSWVHRLELDKTKGETWTLFIPFKKEKDWGFYTKDGFVDNETYLSRKKNKKED
tara:strand:- start:24 stop:725 length:702 start_codon:yes stop_codon:yes gene_type:complete